MIDLDNDLIMLILSCTGNYTNEKYTTLKDIRQIYLTSTRFAFLKDVYYTMCVEDDYSFNYITYDFYYNRKGPIYKLSYCDISNGIVGYLYSSNNINNININNINDTNNITNNINTNNTNVYFNVVNSTLVLLVVNDISYHYDGEVDHNSDLLFKQIYDQMNRNDPTIKTFIYEDPFRSSINRFRPLLIRDYIPPNNYTLNLDGIELRKYG